MPIRNDEQLHQARDALEREVTNPRNLAVMTEGTFDEIARIEREVNAYVVDRG